MANKHQESKVFIGGLSWDTNDTRLRTYFENFGVVKEAFVSYDRDTGKPRGFGFVVFEDSTVADRVVQNKHTIDRREVDAKYAMPRQDTAVAKPAAVPAPEAPSNLRKIFVGGLPASVVDSNLRQHFERYGTVEDAIVMIDHQSKRPRGFGFVTFHDEKSLDNVLKYDTRQTLHGKEVEVKRAVPRDQLQQFSPRLNPRANFRGYDMRQLPPYPHGFPPGALPFGFSLEAHHQMERQLHAYYGARLLDPEMPMHMMHAHPQMRGMDTGEAVPNDMYHWSQPQADGAGPAADRPDGLALDAGRPPRSQVVQPRSSNGGGHVSQNGSALPGPAASYELRDDAAGDNAQSQPVPFGLSQKGHSIPFSANGSVPVSSADAFENLASSLGASLPLSGGAFAQNQGGGGRL